MITRKKEKDSIKKRNYFPSSDIESSPISNSHQQKIDHKKKPNEEELIMTKQMKMHHLLEILEFRIHFDQDQEHGHPAQSVSILDELPDHAITDISEEEQSMKYSYKLINPVQIIPDFWPKRVYDDRIETSSSKDKVTSTDQTQNSNLNSEDENKDATENEKYYDNNQYIIPMIKLSKKESQILLDKIIAASDVKLRHKPKLKKNLTKHSFKISLDKDDDFSNSEEDDEFERSVSSNKRSRSQFRFKKSRKEFILTLPSLLYDTDESLDETDGELF